MILQELVDVGNVKISDSLLDANNVVMKVGDVMKTTTAFNTVFGI